MSTFISTPFKYIISITVIFILLFSSKVNAKELFDSWDDLTLVGGFTVPATLINGFNTRYAKGSFDKRPGSTIWIAHHGVSGYIVEYIEPSEPDMTFPVLTYHRYGKPFTTVSKMSATAAQWVDENNVIVSGRMSYSFGSTYHWMSLWNLVDGSETLQTVGNVDATGDWAEGKTYNHLFHLHQALGGGFTRIPEEWANANGLAGKTVGLAAGGYDALNSPLGPAAGAYKIGDTMPTYLMDYPTSAFASDGKNHVEIRYDTNYSYPTYVNGDTSSANCPEGSKYSGCNNPIPIFTYGPDFGVIQDSPRLSGPTGNTGYFMADQVSHGAGWIDDNTFKGVVYGVQSPNGYIDYDTQEPGFLVWDPADFYDGTTGHYEHPTDYSGGPAGSHSNYLYVYDPDCFASVAAGTTDEWACSPTIIVPDFSDLPIKTIDRNQLPTKIGGVFWDEDRGYLWLILTQMSSNNKYPLMVAYKLKEPPRSPIGLKIEAE